jgi:CRP-like cAMP-binding protein
MSESVNADEIANTPICAELTRECVDNLVLHMTQTRHAKGEVLYSEGSLENNDLLVLLEGEMEIKAEQRYQHVGSLKVTFKPGAVASLLGFVVGHPHVTTATALTDCRVARLSREQFTHICDKHPQIAIAILKYLVLRLDESSATVLDRYKDAMVFMQNAYNRR